MKDIQEIKGIQKMKGILNSVTFETLDSEVNEDTLIDVITLNINSEGNSQNVFVYPFRDLIKVSSIPPFLVNNFVSKVNNFIDNDNSKSLVKYEIIIIVRNYGTYLIALDIDFFNAVFGVPKENFNELENVREIQNVT